MALTKTPIELSSTPGIVDNSNATAITIDASENVTLAGTATMNGLTVTSSSSNAGTFKAVGGYALQAYQDATSANHTALELRSDHVSGGTDRYLIRGYNTAAGTPVESFNVNTAGGATFSGNVGIGTSSPSAGLELNLASGDGLLINSADVATIKMKNTSGVVKNWGLATSNLAASDFGIYQSNSNGGDPITAGTARMYFDASGNLLVGKTVGSSPGTIGLEVQQDGEVYSTIATGFNTYHVYANSGYRFYVNPNGGLYNYSANNVNLSDEREKKNIEALESQWGSLQQWSLKKFHYNADADSDTKKLGVIAQEVEVHNPEVISEFSVDEDTTRMAVKEQQMMWMAIKALQEAMERIETLEAKVQTLENN